MDEFAFLKQNQEETKDYRANDVVFFRLYHQTKRAWFLVLWALTEESKQSKEAETKDLKWIHMRQIRYT